MNNVGMKFLKSTIEGKIKVFDDSKMTLFATFENEAAYHVFMAGVSATGRHNPGTSLYDDDTGQFMVGNLDEMMASRGNKAIGDFGS